MLLATPAYVVSEREDKPTRSKPPAPFITSTLQQARARASASASRRP
jgi:DNA topoisomerase IA